MGLQKYRADYAGPTQPNGATPYFSQWLGGPTLAKIANCPIENRSIPRRMVYITGEPDSAFSVPAAIHYQGRTVRGYVTTDDNTPSSLVFRALDGHAEHARF